MRLTVILLLTTSAALAWTMYRPPARPAASPARAPITVQVPPAAAPVLQASEHSAVGVLDQVDSAKMEIVVTTSAGRMAFRVQSPATIRQGTRTIKPAELAAHKGERVKVRYRDSGKEHVADWIVLAKAKA